LLIACQLANVNIIITLLYLLSLQIILAYTLNNLFTAILLQGFNEIEILVDDDIELYDEIDVFKNQSNTVI
jgi:hypothetical protein